MAAPTPARRRPEPHRSPTHEHPPPPPGLRRHRRRLRHVRRLGRQGALRTGRARPRPRSRPDDRPRARLRRAPAQLRDAVPRLERPQGARRDAARPARVLRLRRGGAQVLRQRHREPVHHRPGQALPVDPRTAGGRALDHVGAAELPPQRPRLRGQRPGRLRRGLADPLRRPRPLVRPRRGLRRDQRPRRGAAASPRRGLPAAHGDVLRRGACGRRDRPGLRRAAADDDRPHRRPHRRSQGAQRLPLLRPLPPRLPHPQLLQLDQCDAARRRGHRTPHPAAQQRGRRSHLGSAGGPGQRSPRHRRRVARGHGVPRPHHLSRRLRAGVDAHPPQLDVDRFPGRAGQLQRRAGQVH